MNRQKKGAKGNENQRSFTGIDANSRVLTGKELEDELKVASNGMIYNREKVKNQLQEELFKEKEFMMNLPEEVNKKIQFVMNQQLERMKLEINQGTNQLRDNILNLRAKAIELDEERRRAAHEVNRLRTHLANIQYDDDIRNNELMAALADDQLNRILPTSSSYQMPEPLLRDFGGYDYPIKQGNVRTTNNPGGDFIGIDQPTSLYSNEYFSTAGHFQGPDSLDIEQIYNRNLHRNQIFSDALEGRRGHFDVQDYIERDLEESKRKSGLY